MKIIVFVFCLFVSLQSYADWFEVHSNDKVSINIPEENTYTIDDNYIYLWVLYDLKKPSPDIASWAIYTKGNCRTIETKGIKKVYYSENMARGDVVMTKGEDSEWESYPPGSTMYSIIKTFCD